MCRRSPSRLLFSGYRSTPGNRICGRATPSAMFVSLSTNTRVSGRPCRPRRAAFCSPLPATATRRRSWRFWDSSSASAPQRFGAINLTAALRLATLEVLVNAVLHNPASALHTMETRRPGFRASSSTRGLPRSTTTTRCRACIAGSCRSWRCVRCSRWRPVRCRRA
ncbi:hypothetical protein DFH08DRAFT_837348 [Mycena albidolilacea]|uniref:Uncharacterized protein n=1 Tax=Mycena albidolilacea TaxID=1033008 RepID=A0AAD7AT06_9AGAR|nr:hypothetical protein DFH08DRAFT_837348 [Mycena albidolilacea]